MGDLPDLQFQVLSQQSHSRELPPLNCPLPVAIVPPALPDYVQPDSTKITSLSNGFKIASRTSEGIQDVKGPGGKLRYPSRPSHKLMWSWFSRELGDFQCYDEVRKDVLLCLQTCNGYICCGKYMLASFNACAREVELTEWGNGRPYEAGNSIHDPGKTQFLKSETGYWIFKYTIW